MIHNDCDSYISHLRSEHQRLELCAANVYESLQHSRNQSAVQDRRHAESRLRVMQHELLRHIEIEEEGGCMEEAIARTPWLSRDARVVYQENGQLEEELSVVLELVELGDYEQARLAFTQFAIDLAEHDRHEASVVEQGLYQVRSEDAERCESF